MYIGIALYYIYVYVDLSANFRIQKMLAEFSLVFLGSKNCPSSFFLLSKEFSVQQLSIFPRLPLPAASNATSLPCSSQRHIFCLSRSPGHVLPLKNPHELHLLSWNIWQTLAGGTLSHAPGGHKLQTTNGQFDSRNKILNRGYFLLAEK